MNSKRLAQIVRKYNKQKTPAFRSKNAERRFLTPLGLSSKSLPSPSFEHITQSLTRQEESQHFEALHFIKFKLSKQKQANSIWYHLFLAVRNKIATSNVGLVHKCLRLTRVIEDRNSLLSRGLYCLICCVENFDPWRGYRFSTYACRSILRSFVAAIPIHPEFSLDDNLANSQSFPVEDVKHELAIDRLGCLLHCPEQAGLTQIEFDVIVNRYGIQLNGTPVRKKLLTEIGNERGLTKERIRQIEMKALGKLRVALVNDPVLQ